MAFRIVAWQALYHGKRVLSLGPRYHCPTCILPEKDVRRGCPKCDLTKNFEYFKQRIILEAYKRYGTSKRLINADEAYWPFEFSLTDVLDAYTSVRRLLDDNNEKISPEWDLITATLARVILSERNQYDFGRTFEG